MTLLGLDFDNTLVRYDELFRQLALEKGLINESLPADKKIIRDYLREKGQDEQFTLMQGEVYGLRILEAKPSAGVLEALRGVRERGIPMALVSHKTRTPYKGPSYDLHKAAMEWLEKHGFFSSKGIGWTKEQVHFANTKTEKISMIEKLNCTHYIDDLEEILEKLGQTTKKILYSPNRNEAKGKFITLEKWENLQELI